jgi:hypothetical protein
MVPMEEAVRSIFGAYRLARLDSRGITLFNGTREGAINSFWAAGLLLPFYAILIAFKWAGEEVALGQLMIVESLAYVIAWTAFPVLMIPVAKALNREERYFGFVAAYNWTQVVQMIAVIVPVLLISGRVLPMEIGSVLLFVAHLLVLIYEGWVIKLALSVGGLEAAGLVLLDLMVGLLLQGATHDAIVG